MSTIFYAPGTGGYFADRFPAEPGKTVILFAHGPDGFSVRVPDGVDWADYEEQPDLEVPQPDDGEGNPVPPVLVPQAPLRHPRDPWAYYQQAYPEIVGNAAQPDAEEANSWQPPEPEPLPETPVTDVDKAIGNFKAARLAAPEALDKLKGTVWAALVAGGMTPDEATAAGVGLVLIHGPLLAAFEAAGGHPVAGQALYAAIASKPSTDALPWLTKGILEVFEAALVPK